MNRNFRHTVATVVVGAPGILFSFPAAQAATQGSADATSTGTVTINASVAPRVDLTNLSDVTFSDGDLGAIVKSANRSTKTQNVCVWSNNPDKTDCVTATGSGATGAFTPASNNKAVVPYQVYWAPTTGQTTGTQLLVATKSGKQLSSATAPTCGGGTDASLIVGIQGSDANSMIASTTYTGTLTLLVGPN